jgi:hypothetical protein
MKNNINVRVASFRDAFQKFLSYSDGSFGVEELASFSKLKEKGAIGYRNKEQLWDGNHSSSQEFVELCMVETPFISDNPCRFYVVSYLYVENSNNSCRRKETHVFVPNE